jgi:hypothetical protein
MQVNCRLGELLRDGYRLVRQIVTANELVHELSFRERQVRDRFDRPGQAVAHGVHA